MQPSAFANQTGELIDCYRLVKIVGAGGMGVVWEAIEEHTGRRVAVKRLSNNMVADPESHQRFVREAQLAARISHPNVTFIFGAGESDGIPYIAMELMPGNTLADKVHAEGPMEVREAIDRLLEAIDGLIAAHRIGLIHRDVKPANCFLSATNHVKIGDFGLSKSLAKSEVDLTKTGIFMGTPTYSAPEQIRGAELDIRTDVYAVGATLFNLLTGRTPFVGDALSVTAQIISDPPESPRALNSKISPDLARVILKCLEKEPSKRFSDLETLKTALIPFASHGTSLANFGRRLAAFMTDYLLIQAFMLVLVVIAGAVIGFYTIPQGKEVFMPALSRLIFWSSILGWILLVAYFSILEGWLGQTVGKRILGLRVVDSHGERPAFWRSLLRAFVIPGCFGITLGFEIYQAIYLQAPIDAAGQFVSSVSSSAVMLIVVAISLGSMRARNRFRGLHGFLSGTRVVWHQDEMVGSLKIPKVQATAHTIDKKKFGPYESDELLGTSRLGEVYLGFDAALHRKIWIVLSGDNDEPSPGRINLARPGRQRWLAGGHDPVNGRWDAIQAVDGLPIQALVGLNKSINWQQYRIVLLQLAQELRDSIQDRTLPTELTLPQVWVDDRCQTVLLDRRLVKLVSNGEPFAAVENHIASEVRAMRLLQETGDLLLRTNYKLLPLSAQQFLLELADKPQTAASIGWAIAELESMSEKLAHLDWDIRAGVLGASGVEFLTYCLVAGGLFLVSFHSMSAEIWVRFLAGLGLSLILPVLFGFWFRGGLVFRFMEINVCNQKGGLASRLRCAVRSLFAWTPPIALSGLLILMSIAGESKMDGEGAATTALGATLMASDYLFVCVLFISFGLSSLILAGVLFALRSPSRGLQDYCAGTRLMPG